MMTSHVTMTSNKQQIISHNVYHKLHHKLYYISSLMSNLEPNKLSTKNYQVVDTLSGMSFVTWYKTNTEIKLLPLLRTSWCGCLSMIVAILFSVEDQSVNLFSICSDSRRLYCMSWNNPRTCFESRKLSWHTVCNILFYAELFYVDVSPPPD